MENYVRGLNPQQAEAVRHDEGPLLVVAGAGSGKTKVLTCRIAHLMENGVRPEQILAITFTNKAAQEMRNRVAKMVGETARHIWLYTFHSFCALDFHLFFFKISQALSGIIKMCEYV